MTVEQIERIAMNNSPMPDGLTTSEELLFLKLRYLYAAHRLKIIDREQGGQEKRNILKSFEGDKLNERIWDRMIKIRNGTGTMLSDMTKSDCERCRRMAALIDGRNVE